MRLCDGMSLNITRIYNHASCFARAQADEHSYSTFAREFPLSNKFVDVMRPVYTLQGAMYTATVVYSELCTSFESLVMNYTIVGASRSEPT